jgi:hypothetical protein
MAARTWCCDFQNGASFFVLPAVADTSTRSKEATICCQRKKEVAKNKQSIHEQLVEDVDTQNFNTGPATIMKLKTQM